MERRKFSVGEGKKFVFSYANSKVVATGKIKLTFWDMNTVQSSHTIFHKELCFIL